MERLSGLCRASELFQVTLKILSKRYFSILSYRILKRPSVERLLYFRFFISLMCRWAVFLFYSPSILAIGDTLSDSIHYIVWISAKNDIIQYSIQYCIAKIRFKHHFNSKQLLVIQFKIFFNAIVRESLILVIIEKCPRSVRNRKQRGFNQKKENIDSMYNSFICLTIKINFKILFNIIL